MKGYIFVLEYTHIEKLNSELIFQIVFYSSPQGWWFVDSGWTSEEYVLIPDGTICLSDISGLVPFAYFKCGVTAFS